MKKILKDYFTFTRKERTAVIILAVLIVVFIVLPYFIPVKKYKPVINEALQQQVEQVVLKDSFVNRTAVNEDAGNETAVTENVSYELFEFNPNTIDEAGWKKLGLRDKTIKTILNYRSKGGKFKSAEDIRKIWGLKKKKLTELFLMQELKVFIQIIMLLQKKLQQRQV